MKAQRASTGLSALQGASKNGLFSDGISVVIGIVIVIILIIIIIITSSMKSQADLDERRFFTYCRGWKSSNRVKTEPIKCRFCWEREIGVLREKIAQSIVEKQHSQPTRHRGQRSNSGLIHYFPIVHNALCLPPKFCINYCCEILLGGLHIPKSIPQQKFMQNLGGKQSALWGIGK